MSQSNREDKVELRTLPVPAAQYSIVMALGDSKLCLHQGAGYPDFFVVDLESPKQVMQFMHPGHGGIYVFCVSKDKKHIVTASRNNCCIWRVEKDEVRQIKNVDMPLKKNIKKILLCNDNTHLISITLDGKELSVFNLDTHKNKTFKNDEFRVANLNDICLLEKEDTTKLFVAAGNGLFMFDVNFISEKILNNPQQLRSQMCSVCDVSTDGSCLAVGYDARSSYYGSYYGAIYHINENFSLTEFGSFEVGEPMSLGVVRFLDDHVLVLMLYRDIFTVNLDSDELKAVKQVTGLIPADRRNHPPTICTMPDGSMLHISGNIYSRLPPVANSLYTQALEELFHRQVLAGLPVKTSLDVAKIILSYTQKPVKSSALFESKSMLPEQKFLESILDELIKSDKIPERDRNALASFKAIHMTSPEMSLKKCWEIMQEIAQKPGKEISFGLSRFFAKIQHLDLPAKKLEGPSPKL